MAELAADGIAALERRIAGEADDAALEVAYARAARLGGDAARIAEARRAIDAIRLRRHERALAPADLRADMQAGAALQDHDRALLQSMAAQVRDAARIGEGSLATLAGHTEQLARIDADVERVDAAAMRADRQLRSFLRRTASDRCHQTLLLLLAAGAAVAAALR